MIFKYIKIFIKKKSVIETILFQFKNLKIKYKIKKTIIINMINVTKLKLILSPYAYHSDNHHHTELKLLLLQNQSSEQNEHLLPF